MLSGFQWLHQVSVCRDTLEQRICRIPRSGFRMPFMMQGLVFRFCGIFPEAGGNRGPSFPGGRRTAFGGDKSC